MFVIARLHGQPVGCGALLLSPGVGQIRRMRIDPPARGLGSVGSRDIAPFNDAPYAHHWFEKALT